MSDDSPKPTVLIIDDEQDIVGLIAYNLQLAGFDTLEALNGNDGLALALRQRPDLIVLDLMLPGMNGIQVFEALERDTRTKDIPVIMLSAKAETADRITGLKLGADDYMTKPFSPKELVLRVQSILRWIQEPPAGVVIRSGPLYLDKSHLRCYLDGECLNLTTTEFKLLAYLIDHAGETVTREALLAKVWGYEEDKTSRTVDTHLMRLREKLGDSADVIRNVRGQGYRFEAAAEGSG